MNKFDVIIATPDDWERYTSRIKSPFQFDDNGQRIPIAFNSADMKTIDGIPVVLCEPALVRIVSENKALEGQRVGTFGQ